MSAPAIAQFDENGVRKAAALLLAMSRETAARLLQQFDQEDVERILGAAADLGAVDLDDVYGIIDQFADGLREGPKLVGTFEEAERIANAAFAPERAQTIIGTLSGAARDVMKEFARLPESRVVDILLGEHPQVAAVALGRVGPAAAARLLVAAPAQSRGEWLARMMNSQPADDAVIDFVQRGLAAALDTPEAPKVDDKAPARIAGIVNRMEPEEIDAMLGELETVSPEQAQAVRALIFRFDDIVHLSQAARAVVFDQTPTERVVVALSGADEALREAVLSALGQRARRMVEAELSSDASPPKRDISAARRAIAETVLRLSENDAIALPRAQAAAPEA